jgi:uncharacterized membrane protein
MHGKVAGKSRLEPLDLGRGLALVAMAIYHFAWDLEFFGYVEPGLTGVGGWKLFARCIASSFLIIVGFSLFLAHSERLRPASFMRRLALVAGAALAISIITWFAVPGGFIFFGILHQIALASVLGLLFLRLPWPLTLLAAAAFITAPSYLRSTFFDAPWWWWVGLSSANPPSNDYVPLFPWFGAVLVGIALARLARASGLLQLAYVEPGRWSAPLQFIGRNSLAFYLLHQPILIGLVFLATQAVPPPQRSPAQQFDAACRASCSATRDEAFCAAYCVCVFDRLEAENGLDAAFSSEQDAEETAMLNDIAAMCTFNTEAGQPDATGEEPATE